MTLSRRCPEAPDPWVFQLGHVSAWCAVVFAADVRPDVCMPSGPTSSLGRCGRTFVYLSTACREGGALCRTRGAKPSIVARSNIASLARRCLVYICGCTSLTGGPPVYGPGVKPVPSAVVERGGGPQGGSPAGATQAACRTAGPAPPHVLCARPDRELHQPDTIMMSLSCPTLRCSAAPSTRAAPSARRGVCRPAAAVEVSPLALFWGPA